MIQLDQHEGSYLSICKHYRAIYDTPCIQAESEKWQQVKNKQQNKTKTLHTKCVYLPVTNMHFMTRWIYNRLNSS